MPRVLITDRIAPQGIALLEKSAEVSYETDLDEAALIERVGDYEGLVVRSQTKVTAAVIEAGVKLQVIGRAGAGVDNIDTDAATRQGIMVVNSPGGNSIAVAEHTLALLLALPRRLPTAHTTTAAGQWLRKELQGVQLKGKTLGIVGLGRVGSEVARRAASFGMDLIGYDPFLAQARAKSLGVELCDVETVLRKADFVTVHSPLTPETKNLIDAEALANMKPSAYLVNCARGGIVDEEALVEALEQGRLAGAALDVFSVEPPDNPRLLACPQVILTPHLAASTKEAQIDVAVDVAEQILDVFAGRTPRSPVNIPLIPAEVLERLRPQLDLAQKIGFLQSQLVRGRIASIELTYRGRLAEEQTDILTRTFLAGLMRPLLGRGVNLVNAPLTAQSRGVQILESKRPEAGDYASRLSTQVFTEEASHQVDGTVFGKDDFRIVALDGYRVDVPPRGHLLIVYNQDKPGVIGRACLTLGEHGINIAGMQVGRVQAGGDAVMICNVDSHVPQSVVEKLAEPELIDEVTAVDFDELEADTEPDED